MSASTPEAPRSGISKILQIAGATGGFAVLFIAIGYLPALFQAFSGRETAVSRLDARAGSPPCAATLLERSGMHGGWHELNDYLREWEPWAAELMETHLSYPILGYFRSQHINQNWLAALTTVVDASAYAVAYGPPESLGAAELVFRVGRHTLADLAFAFTRRRGAEPTRAVRRQAYVGRPAGPARASRGERAALRARPRGGRPPQRAPRQLRAVRGGDRQPARAEAARSGCPMARFGRTGGRRPGTTTGSCRSASVRRALGACRIPGLPPRAGVRRPGSARAGRRRPGGDALTRQQRRHARRVARDRLAGDASDRLIDGHGLTLPEERLARRDHGFVAEL